VDDLRDKTILTYTPSDIQQIQVTQEKQSFILNRTQLSEKEESPVAAKKESASPPAPKTVWQTTDGRVGDEAAVNRLLNMLSNLRCEAFIEDRGKEDLTTPLITVQLKGTQEHSLSIFAKTEEKETKQPAISSASKYAFLLTDSEVEDIIKDSSNILKEPETNEKTSEQGKPEKE
jgi:hypothetical protein